MAENLAEALKALKEVDFDWALHLKSVWTDIDHDIPSIHGGEREAIFSRIHALERSVDPRSPLGLVIRGNPGAGKTHMLSALRRHVLAHAQIFILVDMTDVRDFWETVNQGFLSSLEQSTPAGETQLSLVLRKLLHHADMPLSLHQISDSTHSSWASNLKELLWKLAQRDRLATRKFADVLRAATLLSSDDLESSALAYNWLLGISPLDEKMLRHLGFSRPCSTPMEAVEGLSWLIGLSCRTVLALDQLDSIVAQYSLVSSVQKFDSDEQKLSHAMIESIAGGLSSLREKTFRTLMIVTCIEETWDKLTNLALSSFTDRFEADPISLARAYEFSSTLEMVASRLRPAYEQFGIKPPYSSWPYTEEFFRNTQGMLPRQVLKHCHRHRQKCLQIGQIIELPKPPPDDPPAPPPHELDQAYTQLFPTCAVPDLNDEKQEDGTVALLIQFAITGLALEQDMAETIEHAVDTQFTGGWRTRPLHARIRQILHAMGDDERHLSLRALLSGNARSYNNRIKLAMGASGIGKGLNKRHLLILRNAPPPTAPTSQNLTQEFLAAGGEFVTIPEEDLRRLEALRQLRNRNPAEFDAWQAQRRPLSQLAFLRSAVAWLRQQVAGPGGGQPNAGEADGRIPVGARWIGQQEGPTVALPLEDLSKHTVVLAGSGSGKTVLIRRLVEEAALKGIPAIVIDGANDLARLGDRWDQPPAAWRDGDDQKAETYHRKSEVILWTPGRESGNPLQLNPLPNFAEIDDPEELDHATDMARDALQDIVAQGNSQAALLKRGILKAALNHFAATMQGANLDDFIALLRDLPMEACNGIATAEKKAQEMAGVLWAEVQNNPLFRQSGHSLDPALLLGTGSVGDTTRISVINLNGLQGLAAQRQFLNQLFMTLFIWIKKNPPPPNTPLRGLLVLDEAKDFVPSRQSTACKSSFNRLVAQARKYGLGIVIATQEPKSIDHNVIANCSTQFFGKANSPAAITVVSEAISQRGGNPGEVSRLKTGQFYVSSEAINPPAKIRTPLCLSYHPSSPLSEEEVIRRATIARMALASTQAKE